MLGSISSMAESKLSKLNRTRTHRRRRRRADLKKVLQGKPRGHTKAEGSRKPEAGSHEGSRKPEAGSRDRRC